MHVYRRLPLAEIYVILHVEQLSIDMLKRRSLIWQFFIAGESDRQASCSICNTSVSRGGQSAKSFTTTNLVGHLRKHPPEFKKYEDEKSASASEQLTKESRSKTLKQVTLEESSICIGISICSTKT